MKKLWLLLAVLISVNSFAQSEKGNGGNLTEGDLKYFITKLDRYLQSDDAKNAFPELGKYDETHQDATIHMIAEALNPTLKAGEVLDSFGNPRDCVSYTSPVLYFSCNSTTLPDNTLEHQPSFYRLVFHEILVQAGLEVPLSKEIPSEYPIASRLDVHLETFQEWVPGAQKSSGTRLRDLMLPSPVKLSAVPVEQESAKAFLETYGRRTNAYDFGSGEYVVGWRGAWSRGSGTGGIDCELNLKHKWDVFKTFPSQDLMIDSIQLSSGRTESTGNGDTAIYQGSVTIIFQKNDKVSSIQCFMDGDEKNVTIEDIVESFSLNRIQFKN